MLSATYALWSDTLAYHPDISWILSSRISYSPLAKRRWTSLASTPASAQQWTGSLPRILGRGLFFLESPNKRVLTLRLTVYMALSLALSSPHHRHFKNASSISTLSTLVRTRRRLQN